MTSQDLENTKLSGGAYSGQAFKGSYEAVFKGQSWSLHRNPPLDLNVKPLDDGFLCIPSDASGGLRGGDSHVSSLRASGKAKLWCVAPSALLFHRGAGLECLAQNHLVVEDEAQVFWRNRPCIPCEGARIRQDTQLDIAKGCEFYWFDLWTSGRSAFGEHWAFKELASSLSLVFDGRLLYRERWNLRPQAALKTISVLDTSEAWVTILASGEKACSLLKKDALFFSEQKAFGEMSALGEGVYLYKARLEQAVDMNSFTKQWQHLRDN